MTGVLDGVKVGDKVVVERADTDRYTRKLSKVRSVEAVTRVFKRVIQVGGLTGIDIETGRCGWELRETVRVSPLLPGQETEIKAENEARIKEQQEKSEARQIEREMERRCCDLRNDIRYHLNIYVPENVLQRVLSVLTGKDGA